MADKSGKDWMAIGETDDPNAIIESYEAAADITKGDPVYLSADDKVSPAAASQECIGIATKTVSTGDPCPVLTRGRVKVAVGGVTSITLGGPLEGADASKRLIYATAFNKAFGYALQLPASTGDLIFMKVVR